METLLSLDSHIVVWLNQWVGRLPLLDSIAKLIVGDYFIPVALSLCLLGMWFVGNDSRSRDINQRAVLTALLAVGFANLAVLILNQYYVRDRPFVAHELTMLFYQPTDSSFPANPVAVGFAMATPTWQAHRRLGLLLFGLAAILSLSRIYAGVFYPTDVVTGALIGMVIAYMVAGTLSLIEPLPTLVLQATRRLHLA